MRHHFVLSSLQHNFLHFKGIIRTGAEEKKIPGGGGRFKTKGGRFENIEGINGLF